MQKSINKTTVIIVLAVFLTLSVGYALFSDTITIEGTATAQGNFDIEVTCLTVVPDEFKQILGDELESYGYKDESCVVTDDKITYSVSLEYPGAKKYSVIKLTNVGTIDSQILDEKIWDSGVTTIKTYDSKTNSILKEIIDIKGDNGFLLSDRIFQKLSGSMMLEDDVFDSEEFVERFFDLKDEDNPILLLRTGDSMYLLFGSYWKESLSEENVYYEFKTTIEYPFEQYNG